MNKLLQTMRKWVIRWKSRRLLKTLPADFQFPLAVSAITRVLVIMPRHLNELDAGTQFVQQLRRSFEEWRIEIFDVDKLDSRQLNWLGLPRQAILNSLREANYDLTIDLNMDADLISSYVALNTAAPYRLHPGNNNTPFYNITCHIRREQPSAPYEPLLKFLDNFLER